MKFFRLIFSRAVMTALFIVLQFLALLLVLLRLYEYFAYFYVFCLLISAVAVFSIVSRDGHPSYKIAWLIPILSLPIFGILLYVVFGRDHITRQEKKRMADIDDAYAAAMERVPQPSHVRMPPEAARISEYIRQTSRSPVFYGTETTFLPVGEDMFREMLAALESAEKFIYLEYYIINRGKMWDSVHEILRRKAKEGLDVRVMYDDFGCMFRLPAGYNRRLEKEGIRCRVFNRFRPLLSSRFNNRDHRKICVVDGNIGFTGGINLSDEYINAAPRCGHWLDCAVMLRGEGVYGLTAMFLSLWDYVSGEDDDIPSRRPDPDFCRRYKDEGWVQPFADTPLDKNPVGEKVYLQLINRATRYVYINTPYLIIDDEMLSALSTAARSGVDVRIVTPAICDSRVVQEISRSNYEALIRSGVRIFEYTPGMVHAKTFIADDIYGVVGTINLDYRSLYLHFECAVWMFNTPSLSSMKKAYLQEVAESEEITLEMCRTQRQGKHILRAVLRTLAPLF